MGNARLTVHCLLVLRVHPTGFCYTGDADPSAPGGIPLVVVATGPYIREGFDCPILDALFLAAPVGYKGSIVRWAGRVLRAYPGKASAEVHDYHDVRTPVLAATLARRAPGYISLGFPDPRRIQFASAARAG